MRLEIDTYARKGDLLDEENKLAGRIDVGRGLCEERRRGRMAATVLPTQALALAGYRRTEVPAASLPLTRETAVDRYVLALETCER